MVGGNGSGANGGGATVASCEAGRFILGPCSPGPVMIHNRCYDAVSEGPAQ